MNRPSTATLAAGLACLAAMSTSAAMDASSVGPAMPTVRVLTTQSNALDYWPSFAPDGKLVLFSRSFDLGKTWTLYVVPVAGGPARPLARSPIPLPVSATRATWSAASGLIAFTATTGPHLEAIWVMNTDGSNPRPLAAPGLSSEVVYPSWYPDGNRLAVMDAGENVIKTIDRRSGEVTVLTDPKTVLAGMPSVSPDGNRVAFAGQANTGQPYNQANNVIWLAALDGAPRTLETPPLQGRAPSWSPDGQSIAFESSRGGPGGAYAVFTVNRDGGALRRLTAFEANANHPVWSPDGRAMVFSVQRGGETPGTSIAIIDLP